MSNKESRISIKFLSHINRSSEATAAAVAAVVFFFSLGTEGGACVFACYTYFTLALLPSSKRWQVSNENVRNGRDQKKNRKNDRRCLNRL